MDTHLQPGTTVLLSNAMKQLGNNVRRIRLNARMSQEALAHAALLHRTYVGAVERGERNASLLSILRLAKALGVAATELVVGVDI